MITPTVIEADLTWTGGRFDRGVRIELAPGGTIASLDTPHPTTVRLERRALLPGFVNAHSHAFQRGLRGHGETFPGGAGSFWTWREAMYDLVGRMTPDLIYDLSHQAFVEMRAAGMTSVGEFHYLHHDETNDGFTCDEAVLRAAADAGIRIVLLQAYYRTGGIGAPLEGGQTRFRTASLDAYWTQFDRLAGALGAGQTLGVVAHSIRAVPVDDLVELHAEAKRRGLVMHMHVEEQHQEIAACRDAYGATPTGVLLDRLNLDDRFTSVHCTHTDPDEMTRYAATGARVCLCPLTEANLGDGIADVPGIRASGGRICLGSDSNARIGMTEECRLMEYGQRLSLERRGVCIDDAGANAEVLLECATRHGAEALGLDAGRIATGALADLTIVDLDTPSLAGWTDETLLASLLLGTGNDAIAGTIVGGAL